MIVGLIRAVRRNHALEHGTVSVLLARLGPNVRLAGRASADGFFLYGKLPTDAIAHAADEALARFKQGEASLAVTPHCGTNIAVAGVLTGMVSVLTMGRRQRLGRLPNVFTGAMLAVVAAQPLGRVVQKYVTTSPDLGQAQIVAVRRIAGGFIHKVETSFTPQ